MRKKFLQWLASFFWPLFRDQILPVVWEWLKKNSDAILSWLWEQLKQLFERDATEHMQHAHEQEERAEAEAVSAPNAQVADAWKEAAEYWRREYEREHERLKRNLEEVEKITEKARKDLHATIDNATPKLDFQPELLEVTIDGEIHQIEDPKQ